MFHFKKVLFRHFYLFQAGMSNVCVFVQDNRIIQARFLIFNQSHLLSPFLTPKR